MASYIAIVVTALLGLLGLLFKTKNSEESSKINNLTRGGKVIFFLFMLSCLIGIWIQYSNDSDIKQQKRNSTEANIRDSLQRRNVFIMDSMGHQATIERLELQGEMNTKKIKTDSIRFNTTLSRFSEQLGEQRKTLLGVRRILSPIKNVAISFITELSGDDIPEIRPFLSSLRENAEKLIDPSKDIKNIRINLKKFSPIWESVDSSGIRVKKIDDVYFEEDSNLFVLPNGTYLYNLLHQEIFLNFLKEPFSKFDSTLKQLIPFTNAFGSDLYMVFEIRNIQHYTFNYSLLKNKLTIICPGIRGDPTKFISNGTFISSIDFYNSQLLFNSSNPKLFNKIIDFEFFPSEGEVFSVYPKDIKQLNIGNKVINITHL